MNIPGTGVGIHPSDWYNGAQAAVGLDPSQRGTSGVASKTEPLFKQGLSFEAMSKQTGIPVDQIRSYAATAHPTYGVKNINDASNTAFTAPDTSGLGGGSGYGSSADDPAAIASTKADAKSRIAEILANYDQLFGSVDDLARSRSADLDKTYGDQLNETTKSYTDSIPEIEKSYAAIGAGDSTDQGDAKDTAKHGFDTATDTIQKNKQTDQAAIGNFVAGQKAKWAADRDSVNALNSRLDSDNDLSDLQTARNDVESKLGSVKADAGTLNTDAGARGQLAALTTGSSQFDNVKAALDTIVNGSMSGGVKAAAVQAVTDAGGLTDEDKQKVKQLYGDVYTAPVAA